MKRFLVLLIAASLIALAFSYAALCPFLSGYACRLASPETGALISAVSRLKEEESLSVAAYAVTRTDEVSSRYRSFTDVMLLECFAFDRVCMDISLLSGRCPEAQGEAMLSDSLAQKIDPSLRCLGETVVIRDRAYTITGVYRQKRGTFYTPIPLDVILPADITRSYSEVFLSALVDERTSVEAVSILRSLEQLSHPESAAGTEKLSLGAMARSGQQQVRLFIAAMLVIACLFVWRQEKTARQETLSGIRQSSYSTPLNVLVRAAAAFLVRNYRSWLAALTMAGTLLYCAAHLYLPADAMPDRIFSPQAWYRFFQARAVRAQMENAFLISTVHREQVILRGISLAGLVGLLATFHLCVLWAKGKRTDQRIFPDAA